MMTGLMAKWATSYIEKLNKGHAVQFRPHGKSMEGKIESGQLCTVTPIKDSRFLKKGDIVLCEVQGDQYLHLIHDIDKNGLFLIGNNKGRRNGWVKASAIYGICTKIES